MLVRFKVVLPLFCINLVSGPGDQTGRAIWGCRRPCSSSQGEVLWKPLGRPGPGPCRPGSLFAVISLLGCGLSWGDPWHVARGQQDVVCLTCEDDEPEAPLGVAEGAAPEQHPPVVQGVLLLLDSEGPGELVQFVIGCFADDFACRQAKGLGGRKALPLPICSLN